MKPLSMRKPMIRGTFQMSHRHIAEGLYNETKPVPIHRYNWDEKAYGDFDTCILNLYENMLIHGALSEKLLPVLQDIRKVARGNCQMFYDAVLTLHKKVLDYALQMNNTQTTFTFYWK